MPTRTMKTKDLYIYVLGSQLFGCVNNKLVDMPSASSIHLSICSYASQAEVKTIHISNPEILNTFHYVSYLLGLQEEKPKHIPTRKELMRTRDVELCAHAMMQARFLCEPRITFAYCPPQDNPCTVLIEEQKRQELEFLAHAKENAEKLLAELELHIKDAISTSAPTTEINPEPIINYNEPVPIVSRDTFYWSGATTTSSTANDGS